MNHIGTIRLETDRLILRRFTMDDAEGMLNNWASDDEVTKYLTWPTHQNIETMLPNDKPRQYHSDNVRNTKLIQQYGSKQYNEEYKEEYPCRVGDGKFQAEVKPIHRL